MTVDEIRSAAENVAYALHHGPTGPAFDELRATAQQHVMSGLASLAGHQFDAAAVHVATAQQALTRIYLTLDMTPVTC